MVSDCIVLLKLYWLHVATGGTEPQEGDGIARTRISDPKVYHDTLLPSGSVSAGGDGCGCRGYFVEILVCLVLTSLCWLTSRAVLAGRWFV